MNSPYFVPAPYSADFEFFQVLRGYMKFTIMVDFIIALLAALLWNMQPWFKLEIRTIDQSKAITTEHNATKSSSTALQSNVEIIQYVVQPGDTLSEIAARYGVRVSTLLEYNDLDDPNALYAGQRLKIPRRKNG